MYNNYENLTQKEKNSLVKQYEGCVITITNQFNKKTGIEWQVLQKVLPILLLDQGINPVSKSYPLFIPSFIFCFFQYA